MCVPCYITCHSTQSVQWNHSHWLWIWIITMVMYCFNNTSPLWPVTNVTIDLRRKKTWKSFTGSYTCVMQTLTSEMSKLIHCKPSQCDLSDQKHLSMNVQKNTFLHKHIYIYVFSRRFYPKQLTVHSDYTFFVSMCVPWELNPQPFGC